MIPRGVRTSTKIHHLGFEGSATLLGTSTFAEAYPWWIWRSVNLSPSPSPYREEAKVLYDVCAERDDQSLRLRELLLGLALEE